MGAAVGIDLGTTNSVVAIYKNGKCKVIGDGAASTIPSIVAVDAKGRKMIGQQAKRQTLINPTDTVYGAKRFIGREFGSGTVADAASKFSYQVKEGRSKDVLVHMAGEDYSLEEISALILDHVRNVAQDSLEEEITDAVITVPAYFNESQRQSVKSAGKIAGLNVLRIINEPTAAAIAYGFGKHYNKKIVVYDLGGGTFDVSVLHLRNNVYEVLATGGDTWLGGIDFDNRLIEILVGQFKQETGIDATADPVMLQRIKDAAERAKIDLSSRELVRSQIPYLALKDGEPVSLSYQITREEFNALCSDLVDRTLQICKQVLAEKNLTPADIEEVLLVGGQTRMPIITDKATAFFGKPPSKGAHPDEAVAMGAALMAYVLSGGEQVSKEILLLDTLPMSIGYAGPDGGFTRVFERHSPIPNEKAVALRNNKPGQLVLEIYQGEEKKAKANQYLGRVQFDLATPAPPGQAEVESVFRMDSEGLLHVELTDVANKTSTVHHVKVSSAGSERLHKDLIPVRPAPARPGGTAPPRVQNVTETTKIQIQKPPAPKPASPILPVAAAEKVLDNDEFFGVAAQLKKRQEAKSGPASPRPEAPSKAVPAEPKAPSGTQNQAVKSDAPKAKAGATKPPAKKPGPVVMNSSDNEGFLGKILSKFRKK